MLLRRCDSVLFFSFAMRFTRASACAVHSPRAGQKSPVNPFKMNELKILNESSSTKSWIFWKKNTVFDAMPCQHVYFQIKTVKLVLNALCIYKIAWCLLLFPLRTSFTTAIFMCYLHGRQKHGKFNPITCIAGIHIQIDCENYPRN